MPEHFGKEALLVMFIIGEDDHVALNHVRDLDERMKLRRFGDKPYLYATSGPREVAAKARLDEAFDGIVILVSEHHMLGRARLAFLNKFPKATVICRGCAIREEGVQLVFCADTWQSEPVYADMVLRECNMIERYGDEGHIRYTEDIRTKVDRVRELTAAHAQA